MRDSTQFISIFSDEDAASFKRLKPEQRKMIREGGELSTDTGRTFKVHPKVYRVGGTEIRAIICQPTNIHAEKKEAMAKADNSRRSSREPIARMLWHPSVPESMRNAFLNYETAMMKWFGATIELMGSDRDRAFEGWKLALHLDAALSSHAAKEKGRAKARVNPVARAKLEAKRGALKLWKEREAGKHPKLRTVEQFAMEVMRRSPVLTSPKVICGWSANWTKQVKAGKKPVC